MQVDVKDGLPGRSVRVHHRAISVRRDAFLPRDLRGHERESAEKLRIVRLVQAGNVLAGNHQHVQRSLRIDVVEGHDLVVFEDTDNDGRADKRTTLLTGFGHSDNGSLHGLTFGPDGWLYFTMGNPDSYDLTGPDGSHVLAHETFHLSTNAAHVVTVNFDKMSVSCA